MKTEFSLAAVGLSALALAGPCNNNCGRQVIGTASGRNVLPITSRQELCSSFLTTHTTVTPPAVTETPAIIYNRNVHNRQANPPVVSGVKPTYATMCADSTAYWSACQCFGITPTVITATAPAPVETLGPTTCTQGSEYALWIFQRNSAKANHILVAQDNLSQLNRNTLLSGTAPVQSGIVSEVGFPQHFDFNNPLRFDGLLTGPAGSNMEFNVLEHRGYLVPAAAGTYKFEISMVDDFTAVWVGSHALTGFATTDASLITQYGLFNPAKTFSYVVSAADVGKPVPYRTFWANGGGPAGHQWSIRDSTGAKILGEGTQKNQQIISSCTGPQSKAPAWGPWKDEA